MAQTINISQNILRNLAQQISQFLPSVGSTLAKAENSEIGETFPLWMLPASAVISDQPLFNAIQTGKLYHQIFQNGKAVAFAYSQAFSPSEDDWNITAVFESTIPADIDSAIDIADKEIPQNSDVRLLVLPAYQIQALWIVDENRNNFIIPAAFPKGYQDAFQLKIYSAEDFFDVLKKEQHIIGIQP